MTERQTFAAIGAAVILLCLAYAGNADYKDAQAQQNYQCEMIEKGYWPVEVNPNCERN